MGNLSLTISNFSDALESETLKDNCIAFVTTNGVYFATVVSLIDEPVFEDPKDIMLMMYSKINRFTGEEMEKEENSHLKDINFDETILLENVKYKTGNTTFHAKHVVLNVNQVVSFTLVSNREVDGFLERLN